MTLAIIAQDNGQVKESDKMISDREATDIIAKAIWTEEISKMTLDEMDELAFIQYADDPDVEFYSLDYTVEAGPFNHGINSDEDLMKSYGDQ